MNELLACHEDNAAGSSLNTPSVGYFKIRLEFRREVTASPVKFSGDDRTF